MAAKGKYGCERALVVTNSTYTRQAEELARANGVELWGRQRLIAELLSLRGEGRVVPDTTPAKAAFPQAPVPPPTPVAGPERVALQAAQSTKADAQGSQAERCVVCGQPVSEKVLAYCREHADRFEGRVYCYKHQRGVRAQG